MRVLAPFLIPLVLYHKNICKYLQNYTIFAVEFRHYFIYKLTTDQHNDQAAFVAAFKQLRAQLGHLDDKVDFLPKHLIEQAL